MLSFALVTQAKELEATQAHARKELVASQAKAQQLETFVVCDQQCFCDAL
jgi:hypothetical protein